MFYIRAYERKSLEDNSLFRDSIRHGANADPDFYYVDEKLSVRGLPFVDSPILFSSEDPDWRRFCEVDLNFSIPDWEAESRAVKSRIAPDKP